MKTLSKREKIMLLVLGIVIIAYLYYSLFYTPIHKKIEASKVNINKYIQDIIAAKTNKKQFELQTSELEDIKVKYEEAKTILPQMELNPEIVSNIQKFFQGSGVEVTSITIGAPEGMEEDAISTEVNEGNKNDDSSLNSNIVSGSIGNQKITGKLLTVPVTIALSGDSYEEVMKFISLFENDRRFVEITNIEITANRPVSQSIAENTTKNTAKPATPEKQVENNEIEVIVVGEGEEYKEIPVTEAVENTAEPVIQETVEGQSEENDTNPEKAKPMIEVKITARYYYIDSNTGEKPNYNFNNGINGKKDLFK